MLEAQDTGLAREGNFVCKLLELPAGKTSNEPHDLVAYGDDDGTLQVLSFDDKKKITHRQGRVYDDALRAVAVSPDGLRVAVGFADGSTRIYTMKEGQSFVSSGAKSTSSQTSSSQDDWLATQSEVDDLLQDDDDDNALLLDSDNFVAGPRLDVAIRDLAFDPRSPIASQGGVYYLAVASETGFFIVDVDKPETRHLEEACAREHDAAGVRSLSYHHKSDGSCMLATLDMDGRLCIWDVSSKEDPALEWELKHRDVSKVCSKDVGEMVAQLKGDQDSSELERCLRPVFSKKYLILPGHVDVQLRSIENMEKTLFLTSVGEKGHVEPIVSTAISPDQTYLVTAGKDGRVVLWKLDENHDNSAQSFVCQIGESLKSIPTSILWTKRDNDEEALFMACANGSMIALYGRDQIVPSTKNSACAASSSGKSGTDNVANPEQTTEAQNLSRLKKKAGEPAETDDDATVSFEDIPGGNALIDKERPSNMFVDDEADDNDDSEGQEGEENPAESKETEGEVVDMEKDDIDQDVDNVMDDEDHERPMSGYKSVAAILPKPQSAFAPSSSPLDLPRRILCWNHIGVITLRTEEDSINNMIDMEFTDSAFRRPVTFTDNMNLILGSLGEEGAIFCSDLTGDFDGEEDDEEFGEAVAGLAMSKNTKELVARIHRKRMKKSENSHPTGSNIYFHRFETFGTARDKDWLVTLPDGERALGCACGDGWAAVVTSRRFLRVFDSGGTQGPVIWLKGDPVTVVGREHFLAVIYHESSPLPDGTQKLGYTLIEGVSTRIIASGSLSGISPRSSLSWAGFSDEYSLSVMDTDGMLSMLIHTAFKGTQSHSSVSPGWEFAPFLDTVGLRKSTDDSFWPIAVEAGKLVCIPLKGGNEYPDAARRPVTSSIGLRMPMAKSTPLEDINIRAIIALGQKKFFTDVLPLDEDQKEAADEEYDNLCAKVDKVTLKMFISTVEDGKVHRALDLVERLHLEKSLDIAITVADRLNQRTLSDRIDMIKERKFALPEEEEEPEEYFGSMRTDGDYVTQQSHTSDSSRRISPEISRTTNLSSGDKRAREYDSADDDVDDEPRDKARAPMTVPERTKPNMKPRQLNPFAIARNVSPKRSPMKVKENEEMAGSPSLSPKRLKLSRESTFSVKSRAQSKISKRIM